jgi:hypothetical protein
MCVAASLRITVNGRTTAGRVNELLRVRPKGSEAIPRNCPRSWRNRAGRPLSPDSTVERMNMSATRATAHGNPPYSDRLRIPSTTRSESSSSVFGLVSSSECGICSPTTRSCLARRRAKRRREPSACARFSPRSSLSPGPGDRSGSGRSRRGTTTSCGSSPRPPSSCTAMTARGLVLFGRSKFRRNRPTHCRAPSL